MDYNMCTFLLICMPGLPWTMLILSEVGAAALTLLTAQTPLQGQDGLLCYWEELTFGD